MRLLVLLLLSSPLLVSAKDAHLDAIRALLLPMRSGQTENLKTLGATPALTTVKHELLAWIESRLPVLEWNGVRWNPNPTMLQEQLNEELNQAELFCDSPSSVPCIQQSSLGSLGPVVLDMQPGSILIITTAVGIQMCGVDESAYAYESTKAGWRRFWKSEQNDYQEGKYSPQSLDRVLVSEADFSPGADRTEHLILTLGHPSWCTSNWHNVYYRVWQTKGSYAEPLLLLDGRELSFIDGHIFGSVDRSSVLFEYSVNSIEGGFTRPEIRRYVLRNSQLERVDPVALSPRHFTAFWLSHPWSEISRWTVEASRSDLNEWQRLRNGPFWEFDSPTLHCKQHPDLWQVSIYVGDDRKQQVHFLIRWRPPYRFTMVSASDQPSPDCTEEDREADEPRSLLLPY